MPHKDKPRRRLKNLKIGKVALVDSPAVQDSVFVIAKREEVKKDDSVIVTQESDITTSSDDAVNQEVVDPNLEFESIRKDISELKTAFARLADKLTEIQEVEAEPIKKQSNPRLNRLAEQAAKMSSRANGLAADLTRSRGVVSENGEEDV